MDPRDSKRNVNPFPALRTTDYDAPGKLLGPLCRYDITNLAFQTVYSGEQLLKMNDSGFFKLSARLFPLGPCTYITTSWVRNLWKSGDMRFETPFFHRHRRHICLKARAAELMNISVDRFEPSRKELLSAYWGTRSWWRYSTAESAGRRRCRLWVTQSVVGSWLSPVMLSTADPVGNSWLLLVILNAAVCPSWGRFNVF